MIVFPSTELHYEPEVINRTTSRQEALSIQDPEELFHVPVHQKLVSLIDEDSMISWGSRKGKGVPDELRIKRVFTDDFPIERMHDLSDQDKLRLWQNLSHHYVWTSTICDAVHWFEKAGSEKPHVLFTRCNENFGDFSRHVPNRTADWNHDLHWVNGTCTTEGDVFRYLEHTNTRAIFTTQFQYLDHPKVHSLPLGIKHTMKEPVLRLLREPHEKKKRLLMINDNGWKHRKVITKSIIDTFAKANRTVRNTYSNRKSQQYLEELRRSKFILAPSGLGFDSYRLWEAVHFTTIPIVERYNRPKDGWRRTLEGLPILWVETYDEVTPEMLEREYQAIVSKTDEYKFEKLTVRWWKEFVQSHLPVESTTD